jgi:nicotinamide-nucleotide amidase
MPATESRPLGSAELLAVGAELLAGETRDTNSGDLARSLTALGVAVTRMSQLPDDLEVIAEAVAGALQRADLVITTGGLGPTPDDLTREGIAQALGEAPVVDPGLEAWLQTLWARRGLPFSGVNLKQAWLIPSASALDNPHGTAPGWWVEAGSRIIIALPGPPRELRPMWQERALPRLRDRGLGLDRAAETLRLTGIGESAVVDLVGKELLETDNPRLATYARLDSVDLRVSAVGDEEHSAEQLVQEAIAALSPRLDPYVFGRGEDDWVVALTPRLGERRLATVEAGTAGNLGALLGMAPFLVRAELIGGEVDASGDVDPGLLATQVRRRHGTAVGLATVAYEFGDDMRVDVGLDIEGHVSRATHTIFRAGDIGRRRAANAGASELWRRLTD